MIYDQDGNELEDQGMQGLHAAGDPTFGTSYAEFVGSFPILRFTWDKGIHTVPGVMVQEAQTISPYIIEAGPLNQPQVTTWDALQSAMQDAGIASQNVIDGVVQTAGSIGAGAQQLVKWGAIGLIAYAAMQALEQTKRRRK